MTNKCTASALRDTLPWLPRKRGREGEGERKREQGRKGWLRRRGKPGQTTREGEGDEKQRIVEAVLK